jgi:hypothetical protein
VRRFGSPICRIVFYGLGLSGVLRSEDGSGQAAIGFQQYYLSSGSQPLANISGLTVNLDQFVPNVGLFSASFAPALSNNRFRTGEDYLRLKGLPWAGQHWSFSVGDFRFPGQLLAVPFTNIFVPEISGRGSWVEATHGERTFGFFYGAGTISNTPRVVLRLSVPQTLGGFYYRQQLRKRLLLGVRVMHFSNDLMALRKLPNLLTQSNLKSATTVTLDTMYTLAGPLKIYGEASWSMAQTESRQSATRNLPVSILAGPIFDTRLLTIRANYVLQNASYFPLVGAYLGDRAGPFGEVTIRPAKQLEIFGSASEYRNNIGNDPRLATFRSSNESAGASVQMPAKMSLSTQVTFLNLSTRSNDASPWNRSKNRQESATLTRTLAGHNLRFTVREFKQTSALSSQRQRSGEINDSFHIRRLSLGAGVRLQRMLAGDSRTSLYYYGSAQFSIRRFSAYGNFETGNDLQNRTLFATSTVKTTVLGASLTLGKNWELQCEAYRNNLVTELNPQSIFVLQGQGVFIPGTLAALNQWSEYFRLTRRFHWGKSNALGDVTQYSVAKAPPLRGSVEGFVMERLSTGNAPADGIPVILDQVRTVLTNSQGLFRFVDVPEGAHKVELSLREMPTDFDPGKNRTNSIVVHSSKLSRADFDVVRLVYIQGKLTGPKDAPLDNIVIRMLPGERYTTADTEGNFFFYNLREGEYTLAVDEKTLPEFAVMDQPRISVPVHVGAAPERVAFEFKINKPEKPVRRVLDKV